MTTEKDITDNDVETFNIYFAGSMNRYKKYLEKNKDKIKTQRDLQHHDMQFIVQELTIFRLYCEKPLEVT